MTDKEFEKLKPGDIVSGGFGLAYIITDVTKQRVTAVRTIDITNPGEWTLFKRKKKRMEESHG